MCTNDDDEQPGEPDVYVSNVTPSTITLNYVGTTYDAATDTTTVGETVVTGSSQPSGSPFDSGVIFAGFEANAAGGFGLNGGVGIYVDLSTGSAGWYHTEGVAVGEGAGASAQVGVSTSMDAFSGNSATVTGNAGPVSGTVSGNEYGGTVGVGVGIGAGAQGGSTYTTVNPL